MAHTARTRETREEAKRVFTGELNTSDMVVRVEPWLNRAIAFASAAHLVTLEGGKHAQLTEAGSDVFKKISEAKSIMVEEKDFIALLAGQATEGAIDRIMKMERLV